MKSTDTGYINKNNQKILVIAAFLKRITISVFSL